MKNNHKKQFFIIFILALFILLTIYSYQVFFRNKFNYDNCIDFDNSMSAGLKITFGAHSTPEAEKIWYDNLRSLYNKNCNLNYSQSSSYKIPPIIHHVWLGSEIPDAYKYLRQTWIKNHPGWIFKLWGDYDVDWFNLENKNLFDAARNYGEKSDIFRYEILNRYGGTYFDTDFMCIKSIALLHMSNDFYSGIMNAGEVLIAIGAIGSIPNHPILKKVMSSISETGSKYNINNIMERTGPIHFTKIFVEVGPKLSGSIVAYPVTYFYPVPNTIRGQDCFDKAKEFIKPETFGVHLWECSWMRPQAFLQNEHNTSFKSSKSSYSFQSNIDKFLDSYFKKEQGIFVDIGALDGIISSNTYFLENYKNWKGICIEPDSKMFLNLSGNRKSFCANCAIVNQEDNNKLKKPFKYIYNFSQILNLCKFDTTIDYLSISSAHSKDILNAINFKNINIKLISIKSGQDLSEKILIKNNYNLIKNLDGIKFFEKLIIQ